MLFVTSGQAKKLLRVRQIVTTQLVGSGKSLSATFPVTNKRPFARVAAEVRLEVTCLGVLLAAPPTIVASLLRRDVFSLTI